MEMELDRSLLKEFAQITNDTQEDSKAKQYVRGTVTSGGDDRKYVTIDGSNMVTPISEVVDVEPGDRVLVSIENHKATIIGNFTFPPSARKEQEALDNSNTAISNSNTASEKAQSASEKADTAITESSIASALAGEAKSEASEAITAAQNASQNANEAKTKAEEANAKSAAAQTAANESKDAVSATNIELSKVKTEVANAKNDISSALSDLESQAGEIANIKETYSTKVETNKVKADLTTEITKKVGELQTTVTENYALKTDVVEMEGSLQTQITQNAENISSQASKVEKLEADTTAAQENIDKALADALAAQNAANAAQSTADAAQAAANTAKSDAATAQTKADNAQAAADAAQAAVDVADKSLQQAKNDLAEAQQNLANVTSRVDATEQDIADAQTKVNEATTNVNKALEDVAEAQLAANNAQTAADKAQADANTAKTAANKAQTAANNAQTAADNAQTAADKAQADVAALTNRVTTAETKISQNAEAIELRATKTEVTKSVNDINTNLSNNYYNKTQADAAIKVASDNINLSVSKTYATITDNQKAQAAADNAQSTANTANSKIDNLQIGGRNLLTKAQSNMSNWYNYMPERVTIESTGYDNKLIYKTLGEGWEVIYLTLSNLEIGKVYSLGFDYEVPVAYENYSFYKYGVYIKDSTPQSNAPTDVLCKYIIPNAVTSKTRGMLTFEATANTMYVVLNGGEINDGQTGIYFNFGKWKLEKGNKATDWTPAPEDVEEGYKNYADDAVSDATVTITESYESLIEETAKQINLMIQQLTEITNNQGTSISTISNQLQLTTEMAQFVKTTTEQLQDVVDGKVSAEEIQEWARFDGATLELGASNQPFKAKLSTTELAFYQGENKVAWISNNELHILTAIITKSIGCGNFMFIDEGDLGFSLL